MGETTEETLKTKTMDDFYYAVQKCMIEKDKENSLQYISSRITQENISFIEKICEIIKEKCLEHNISTEDTVEYNDNHCINAYKYFVCNTYFETQSLLSDDVVTGFIVDLQPAFSPHLFLEIIWSLNFQNILAESILHFPLDLGVEILKPIPNCIDLLDFEKGLQLITTSIENIVKKIFIIETLGTQTNNIEENTKNLVACTKELMQIFNKPRFLKTDNLKSDKFKRQGIVIKNISRLFRICLNIKERDIKNSEELTKLYRLTFGRKSCEKLDKKISEECINEIQNEFINLLLHRIKDVDCNTFINWAEYDDNEKSSMTLQRAIGLECHFLIESLKNRENLNVESLNHLIDCLLPISAKPDPKNICEYYTITELNEGIKESNKECLLTLFLRYKEWDPTEISLIDDYIHLLSKNDCFELLENIMTELDNSPNEQHLNTDLYFLYLGKALALLDLKDIYEFSINCILKYGSNEVLNNRLDTSTFLKFIVHNLPYTTSKNLRVVLFYISIKPIETLKILIKLSIEHTDFNNVSTDIDSLKAILPIMRIRLPKTKIIDKNITNELEIASTIPLGIKALREICEEGPHWNINRFSKLIHFFYTFCLPLEVIDNILLPVLLSEKCSTFQLKHLLLEVSKVQETYEYDMNNFENLNVLIEALATKLLSLRRNTCYSKFEAQDAIHLIFKIIEYFFVNYHHELKSLPSYPKFTVVEPIDNFIFNPYLYEVNLQALPSLKKFSLKQIFSTYCSKLHLKRTKNGTECFILAPNDSKVIDQDDVLRHLISRCTKQEFITYSEDMFSYFGSMLKWRNKTDVIDNIIRLTLETFLLFLEFPNTASPDVLGFLIKSLAQLFHRLEGKIDLQIIRDSVLMHICIMKISIAQTRIKDAYNELLDQYESSNFDKLVAAMDKFGDACLHKMNYLKTFKGCHSPKAIRILLGYRFICQSLSKAISDNEFGKILKELLFSK